MDYDDIQGNIVKGYGRYGFPYARYAFYEADTDRAGRAFVGKLVPLVTTGVSWGDDPTRLPPVTTNLAVTYPGLKRLGLPRKSLTSFPPEFVQGMRSRAPILGDEGASALSSWDPIWQGERRVHFWVSMNAQSRSALEGRFAEIQELARSCDGAVRLVEGHRGDGGALLGYQDAQAVFEGDVPTPKEHFGFVDGISDVYFKGSGRSAERCLGAGKPNGKDPGLLEGWDPIETGEFILGYKDEAFEYPEAPIPKLLSHNGSFMVYRKLHQNVGSFFRYLDTLATKMEGMEGEEARETIAAKFAGRWRNGAPLTTFRTYKEALEFGERLRVAKRGTAEYAELRRQLVAFDYRKDLAGAGCPIGAHARRVNPRGALEFGVKSAYETPAALTNRRRILRRGLPYGSVQNPESDHGNHGIVFMAIGASLKRQFEFVQQQWINHGNDFRSSDSRDPLVGRQMGAGHMIFETDPEGPDAPFFCSGIPSFVETRGGDYFFVPSLTALRMISRGEIDPT